MDMKKYQEENAEIQFKHRYWGWQIALYLFLGGLGGGILFLTWVMSAFVFPGVDLTQAFMLPNFIALLVIAFGLFCLVEELGQPPVFYRAYVTATSIIKWGAVLLTIASFGSLFWLLGNWSAESPVLGFLSVFNFFGGASGFWLAAAGIAGFGIMVYTGVMLSTLKAHAFWSTPRCPSCSPPRPFPPLAPASCSRCAVGRVLPAWKPLRRLTRFTGCCTPSTSSWRLPS